MNADLEATLSELGPGYREMVVRMREAYDMPSPMFIVKGKARRSFAWKKAFFLIAASILLIFAFHPIFFSAYTSAFHPSQGAKHQIYTIAYGGRDAVEELVRTQHSDGSWQSDYITQQNAAALRYVADASVAYRKAVRYLRSKGLAPLTDAELREREVAAMRTLNG